MQRETPDRSLCTRAANTVVDAFFSCKEPGAVDQVLTHFTCSVNVCPACHDGIPTSGFLKLAPYVLQRQPGVPG